MTHDIDYLIVGQGLAGSLLASQLIEQGQRVLVVDNDYAHSSSTVAAGLINPVTGKRLVKTVGVDDYLPVARNYYAEWSQRLDTSLLIEKPMWRLLHTQSERERWQQRQQDPAYQNYLGEIIEADQLPPEVKAKYGAGLQRETAYLRTEPLLHGLRDWLIKQNGYQQAQLDYDELKLSDEGVSWREIQARQLIFCEGYKGRDNPWFNELPFQVAKGEFMTVQCSGVLPDVIINSGRWIMPRGEGRYRVGASYDHHQLDEAITDEARTMLLQALPTFLDEKLTFEVVEQQAGVRPTTSDRQPFIGRHPEHPMLAIFNGFGSKGSLLIPWHVERFVDYLLHNTPLPESATIGRFQHG